VQCRMRHRHSVIQASSDLQQMIRIVRSGCAEAKDIVIAGAFAFDAQPMDGIPNEGIEPVHTANNLGSRVDPGHRCA
jgi:hypothetical protein